MQHASKIYIHTSQPQSHQTFMMTTVHLSEPFDQKKVM
jgi:hypothetical protein